MWLEKIQYEGIRILKDAEIVFSPQANYLFGSNGAGKTSILEAIHYLAVGRSFRTNRDNELLKFNAEYFKIIGLAHIGSEKTSRATDGQSDQQSNYIAEIRYSAQIKTAFLQNQKQEKLSSYLGWLPVVTILLSDIELVAGPPHRRRNFLDLAISKINKPYLQNLIEYRRILAQRNKLLQEKSPSIHYEVWETALAKYGTLIYQEREKYLPSLLASAQDFYSMFLPHRKIEFNYKATIVGSDRPFEKIQSMLEQNRVKDQTLGYTTIGPHRDEIVIKEKDLELKKFASEGEMRLAALSLKMAEAELLAKNYRAPIFLLDEVASELDNTNTENLLQMVQSRGQIFYASAKELKDKIKLGANRKIFYVEAGAVKKTETFG